MPAIRIVLVDDHDLVREGMRSLLAEVPDIDVVGEAGTVGDALDVVIDRRPDLVLLDLRLGQEDGADVARQLRAAGARTRIVVLSAHDSPAHLRAALAAGADGYLLKSVSAPALAQAIRDAMAGETVIGHEFVPKLLEDAARGQSAPTPEVTAREHEVLEQVAAGLGNRELAERLGISTRTAQKHIENLFKKFDVHDRTELVATAFRRGVLG